MPDAVTNIDCGIDAWQHVPTHSQHEQPQWLFRRIVLWRGTFGLNLASPCRRAMYRTLDLSCSSLSWWTVAWNMARQRAWTGAPASHTKFRGKDNLGRCIIKSLDALAKRCNKARRMDLMEDIMEAKDIVGAMISLVVRGMEMAGEELKVRAGRFVGDEFVEGSCRPFRRARELSESLP